jgi:uncharacterized protein (TIGR04255 family)
MSFPESPRVTYRNNPLETVVCQLRFPPLLRIETELPARFQETIRAEYPIFRELSPVDPSAGLPQEMLNIVRSMLPVSAGRTYEFRSEDGFWKVTLAKDAIALECVRGHYTAWEQYTEKLAGPLVALRREYAPSFFTRIGLRYVNIIRRSRLNLQNVQWAELLKPQIAAELASPMAPDVVESTHRVLMKLNEHGDQVRIRHSFVVAEDPKEVCYMIDNDFFSEQRTEGDNARAKLEELHRESGNCFRWCIAEPLDRAMGPQLVDAAQRRA